MNPTTCVNADKTGFKKLDNQDKPQILREPGHRSQKPLKVDRTYPLTFQLTLSTNINRFIHRVVVIE